MAPVRRRLAADYAGSFVPAGAQYALWRHYADAYAKRRIYAHVDRPTTVHRNATLGQFLVGESPGTSRGAWFAPFPLTGEWAGTALEIGAVQTGSRTFAIAPAGARALGLPDRVLLNLAEARWGEGVLELRPEVKGTGTPFSRTKLRRPTQASLRRLLSSVPAQWLDAFEHDLDPLFISLKTYEGRPLGGQDARLARHAVRTSEALVGCSPIKIAPTLEYVVCPPEYRDLLAKITQALEPAGECEQRYVWDLSTEVRLTPGNVRAAYFDTTAEAGLVELCGLVSADPEVLEQTYDRMVEDAGRYLDELCEKTVYRSDLGCFTWPKFGDIHIVFRRDRYGYPAFADEYKFSKSAAWYIAKDEVVVGGVGLFYVDLESVIQAFPSVNEEELTWHHDLYALNVLRDHVRVIANFDYARRLAAGEWIRLTNDERERVRSFDRALRALIAASRTSRHYCLEAGRNELTVELRYPRLGATSRHSYPGGLLGPETAVAAG